MLMKLWTTFPTNLFLWQSTPCKHPVIVLQDVAFADLHALVEFIYHGEVNVHQRNLSSFLKTAEVLRVSGLTQQAEDRDEVRFGLELDAAHFDKICVLIVILRFSILLLVCFTEFVSLVITGLRMLCLND